MRLRFNVRRKLKMSQSEDSSYSLCFSSACINDITKVPLICDVFKNYSADGILLVQLPKGKVKELFKKRTWMMRYCTLKDDELSVFIIEKGKEEDVEIARWNLRKAQNLKIHQNIQNSINVKSKLINPFRFVEILDEIGEKVRLSFKDDDEMNFWLSPLLKIFCKPFPYATYKSNETGKNSELKSVGQQLPIIDNEADRENDSIHAEIFEPKLQEFKPKYCITSEIEELKLKRSNESFKTMLNVHEKILNERKATLKSLLNEFDDDKDKNVDSREMNSILTTFDWETIEDWKQIPSELLKNGSFSIPNLQNRNLENGSEKKIQNPNRDSKPIDKGRAIVPKVAEIDDQIKKKPSEIASKSCFIASPMFLMTKSYIGTCKNSQIFHENEETESKFTSELSSSIFPHQKTSMPQYSEIQHNEIEICRNSGAGDAHRQRPTEYIKKMQEIFECKDSILKPKNRWTKYEGIPMYFVNSQLDTTSIAVSHSSQPCEFWKRAEIHSCGDEKSFT